MCSLYTSREVTVGSCTEAPVAVPGEKKGHWLAGGALGRLLSGPRALAARAQEIAGRKMHGTRLFCSHSPMGKPQQQGPIPLWSLPRTNPKSSPLPSPAQQRSLAVEGENAAWAGGNGPGYVPAPAPLHSSSHDTYSAALLGISVPDPEPPKAPGGAVLADG